MLMNNNIIYINSSSFFCFLFILSNAKAYIKRKHIYVFNSINSNACINNNIYINIYIYRERERRERAT